jgi:4-hydroxybenzoate polyprenyltransferase
MISVASAVQCARLYLWFTIIVSSTFMAASVGQPVFVGFAIGLSLSLIASAGFLFNDVVDFEIDAANGVGRLSDASRHTRTQACIIAIAFASGSILCAAATLDHKSLAGVCMVLLGAVAYSYPLRSIPVISTALSTTVSTSPMWFPVFASGEAHPRHILIVLASFMSVFARELILDVRDASGDRAYRRYTIPVLIGSANSVRLAVGILCATIMTIAFLFINPSMSAVGKIFVYFAELGVTGLFLFPAMQVMWNPNRETIVRFVVLSRIGLLVNGGGLIIGTMW